MKPQNKTKPGELTYEPERLEGATKFLLLFGYAPGWWIKLLLFFGFDAWTRRAKQN